MATIRKTGPRSKYEKDKLYELIEAGKSKEQIAQIFNRNVSTIERWMEELHIASIDFTDDVREIRRILEELRTNIEMYSELKQQLSRDELKFFEHTWCQLIKQFSREGVLPAERLQLKHLIMIEISINRNLREKKGIMKDIERLQKLLEDEYKKKRADPQTIANLEQQVSFARNSIGSFTKEYTELLNRQEKINKDLKATRDQRVKKIDDSKTNFAGWLRSLEDEEVRQRSGDDMELMRLAKEKAKEQLGDYHEFEDNTVDIPLLTPETVLSKEENHDNN